MGRSCAMRSRPICRNPSPRTNDRDSLSAGVGRRSSTRAEDGPDWRAEHETRPEHGQSLPQARGSLFPLHYNTRHRPNQQSGGTSDTFCGDRPPYHPRDPERKGPPLVRAHLDSDCHLRPAGARCLSFPPGFSPSLFFRRFSTLATAVRPLTASHLFTYAVKSVTVRLQAVKP